MFGWGVWSRGRALPDAGQRGRVLSGSCKFPSRESIVHHGETARQDCHAPRMLLVSCANATLPRKRELRR